MSRLGIFGGTFNPIHAAHLILAERAREAQALDRVLFVPALLPPHKPQEPIAPAPDRMRMVEMAIEGNPAFEAFPLELERKGPSYTLLTVRELRARSGPTAQLFLLLGADSVRDMPTWWHAQELVREVDIIAFERPGHSLDMAVGQLAGLFGDDWARRVRGFRVPAPLLDISASEIRQRVAAGRSIRYMVPERVRRYILERGLYGA